MHCPKLVTARRENTSSIPVFDLHSDFVAHDRRVLWAFGSFGNFRVTSGPTSDCVLFLVRVRFLPNTGWSYSPTTAVRKGVGLAITSTASKSSPQIIVTCKAWRFGPWVLSLGYLSTHRRGLCVVRRAAPTAEGGRCCPARGPATRAGEALIACVLQAASIY